ncbi:MAG: GGDEF domain-containing protein [Chloroflexota bacterium]
MMKWLKSGTSDSVAKERSPEARDPSPLDTVNFDQSLDSVAALLRLTGRYSLEPRHEEVERIRHASEAWARHALLCTPPPGVSQEGGPATPGRRDWTGLRRFATETRQQEYEAVAASVGGLREAIWSFVDGLSRALVEGQGFDDRVIDRLADLKGTLVTESPEALGRAVESAISDLTRLLQEHKVQQQVQLQMLGDRVSELAEELHEVRRESSVDELTELFNAHAFEEYLSKIVYLRSVFSQVASLVLIDIDGLETINEGHGRQTGDQVLQTVANCLARTFPRRSDVAARLQDDEFAVLMSGTPQREAVKLTERLLTNIRELALPVDDGTVRLTVSVGLSEVGQSEPVDLWLRRTEAALAEAKSTGRDRYWCAEDP